MAEIRAVKETVVPMSLLSTEITLSGNVTVDGSAARRQIIICKNNETTALAITWSDSSGNWSVTVNGGGEDKFRAVVSTLDGETPLVYDKITV